MARGAKQPLEAVPKRSNKGLITRKSAASMGRKGGLKRAANFWKAKNTADLFRGILNSPVTVPDEMLSFALEFGLKLPKEIAFKGAIYMRAAQKQYETGDYKAAVELLKMAGEHFDQGKDALGGANNPLNVSQSLNLSPEEIRKTMGKIDGLC